MNYRSHVREFTKSSLFPTFVVLISLIIVNFILQPDFFSPDILKSNIITFAPLILVSMAQAIVIIMGGIDLSIGAAITLINVILASLMRDSALSITAAILCVFGTAAVFGLLNGILIGYIRLPAMIATLATAALWFGISLVIMPQPGGYIPQVFYSKYLDNILYIVPIPLVIILLSFLIWKLFKKRRIIRYLYAVGGNEEASAASGINISFVRVLGFLISSIFVAIAGIIVTAQTATGDPHIGQTFTLNSVAAAVIGGVSLQGGKGSLMGAAMGACVLGIVINVIFFANIPSNYQDFLKGLIIIIALGIAVIPKIKQTKLNI